MKRLLGNCNTTVMHDPTRPRMQRS